MPGFVGASFSLLAGVSVGSRAFGGLMSCGESGGAASVGAVLSQCGRSVTEAPDHPSVFGLSSCTSVSCYCEGGGFKIK